MFEKGGLSKKRETLMRRLTDAKFKEKRDKEGLCFKCDERTSKDIAND